MMHNHHRALIEARQRAIEMARLEPNRAARAALAQAISAAEEVLKAAGIEGFEDEDIERNAAIGRA